MSSLFRWFWAPSWLRLLVVAVATGYCIAVAWLHSPWQKQRWYRQLVLGSGVERSAAAASLACYGGREQLFLALRHDLPEVRKAAEMALDATWFAEAGAQAAEQLLDAEMALNSDHLDQALALLDALLREHPEYVAGLHRRSEVYWRMGRPAMALRDAERVVQLEPGHFGAWQSMGLCYLHFNRAGRARMCVERYLQIQPHDLSVRKWLKDCERLEREETRMKPRKPVEVLL